MERNSTDRLNTGTPPSVVSFARLRRLGTALLCLVLGGYLPAQTLYVATGSNGVPAVLYSVDPATATYTIVNSVTIGGSAIGLTGLAFHPTTNVLYGVTTNNPGSTTTNKNCLVTINPANGSATLVGSLGRNISDITFSSDGTLYGWANTQVAGTSELCTISLTTGATTLILSDFAGTTKGGGLAFSVADLPVLYMSPTGSSSTLWMINKTTGAATMGPTMDAGFADNYLNAMGWSTANNAMYAVNSYTLSLPALCTLVTINTTTGPTAGHVTAIGTLPGDTDALAFSLTFTSWQKIKFTAAEQANSAVSGTTAVYGQDGIPNLVKYALGFEPKTNITTGLPSVSVSGSEWFFTYTRPSRLTDVSYSVEVSTDLVNWTTTGVTHEFVSTANYIDTYRGRYPLASATNAYFRLNVKLLSTTTVTVSGATYDNTPHGGTASVTAGDVTQSLTVTYTGISGTTYGPATTAPTDAGTYSASASYAGDANHGSSSDSKNFTINKATSTTTLTVSDATYDGSPHGGTATVTGPNLSQSLTVSYSGIINTTYGPSTTAPTNVGDYSVTATYAGDSNHNGSTDTKNFKINQGASTTTVTTGDFSYDGNPHGQSASVTGANLSQSLTVTYTGILGTTYSASATAPTNAGNYSASASYAGDANHTGSSDTKNYQINQANSTTTVTVSSATFDGNPHGGTASVSGINLSQSLTVTYTGINGTTYDPSTTAPSAVGDYSASATFAGDTNHTGSSDSKNFSITP